MRYPLFAISMITGLAKEIPVWIYVVTDSGTLAVLGAQAPGGDVSRFERFDDHKLKAYTYLDEKVEKEKKYGLVRMNRID